jgi:regulator of sirC expression with transglutaminase-like and TPR domain
MTEQTANKELNALVRLMDEPDDSIFVQIRKKILSYGDEAVPYLEKAWENDLDEQVQKRLEILIHEIQFMAVREELGNWCEIGTRNLMLGYLLVTRFQYPDLDQEALKVQIDRIKQDVWLEINDNMTGMEKIQKLNQVLFDTYKFDGSRTNFYAPNNYYFNTVMESRKGSPLALSMIYLVIAQALGIPVFGVNLPEHFILAYADINDDDNSFMHDENKILFYINPFTKGTLFSRREIDLFLEQLKVEARKEFYLPCTNTEIIRRLIRNLIASYEKLGQKEKTTELSELLEVLDKCQ